MREQITKVLIVEPSVIIAEGLRHIIDAFPDFSVVNIQQDAIGASMQRLSDIDADLVIVDPSVCSGMLRTESERNAFKELLNVPVVALLTTAMEASSISRFDNVIYLADRSDEIEHKLKATIKTTSQEQKSEGEELSSREKEILVCVAKGMLNKEIADHFNISIYTVITHRKNITRKTGIKTVAGLTVYALLNNMIDMSIVE